jgi:hypothetical protein
LLPKSRIDAIGEIPYRMFGEKMAICIAYDNENIRAYLNEEKCKELNVSLDENFEELRQNLERRISQSSISWQEMLEGITIIKGDNAASWLLTDSFWEPGFFPASTSVFPTKKIEIITIIDQDFICVESYDSFTNHVQQTQQTHPAMDYSLVIKMLSSVFVSFKEPHYEGEMFIRTNGKTEPFKPLINKKAENSKQNHKWWKFW